MSIKTALHHKTCGIAMHPKIKDLANVDPDMIPLFTPIERAVIEVCRDIAAAAAAQWVVK